MSEKLVSPLVSISDLGSLIDQRRHLAQHVEHFGYDAINRYQIGEQISPYQVWENVRNQIVTSPNGLLIFDEQKPDPAQWSTIDQAAQPQRGYINEALEVVIGVYIKPDTGQFWIIDYRLCAPETDVKSKLDHMHDMLTNAVHHKRLLFRAVWLDNGYASRAKLLFIEQLGKVYYCPIQANRLIKLNGDDGYSRTVETLRWSADELRTGQWVHLPGFPIDHQVRLFKLERPSGQVDYIVTNDVAEA